MINRHVTHADLLPCAVVTLGAKHNDVMLAVIHSAHIRERVKAFHFADGDNWHASGNAIIRLVAYPLT